MHGVKGSAQHGTHSCYVLGCRCDLCRAAQRAHKNALGIRSKGKAERLTVHARGPLYQQFGLDAQEEAILIALGHLPNRAFTDVEIAEAMGCSRQNVNYIANRALDKVRAGLASWEGEVNDPRP